MLLPNSPPSASAPFSPPIDVVSPTPDGPPSDYDEEGTRGADPFLYTPELPPNGGPRPTSVFQSAVLDALDKAIATGLMGPNFRKNPNVSKVDRPRPDSLDRSFYPKEDKHFWVVTCGTIVGIFNKWSTASSAAHSDDDTSIKACLTWDSAVKHYEKAFNEDRIAVGPFKKQKIRDAPQSNPRQRSYAFPGLVLAGTLMSFRLKPPAPLL
ncbi:hypothetical protein NLJ89_g11485 [Agrocybe chaxingu]|uniref:Uncharacterized protein n=1 Tax=Agrocybe chaxingu TaxID=84603 RepID=A0A9W8MR48_9AGAR|nr:hypothetical protein NLJ89_g11485 [Agrocybe chaxingu]